MKRGVEASSLLHPWGQLKVAWNEQAVARLKLRKSQALLLDPLMAAVCSPAEISQVFDEMWAAERKDLTAFE